METRSKRRKIQHFQQEKELMDLSNEVLEMIFLQLSQSDIQLNLALVCRRFLNITRHPKFVQTVEIEPIGKTKNWDQFKCFPEYDFPGSCLKKIRKVKKIYPNCKIELKCLLDANDNFGDNKRKSIQTRIELKRYTWMKKFRPYAKSITKLTLMATHLFNRNLSHFLYFENLESLDIDFTVIDEDIVPDIQEAEANFWGKFPKLKSLRINANYGEEDCVSESFIFLLVSFAL